MAKAVRPFLFFCVYNGRMTFSSPLSLIAQKLCWLLAAGFFIFSAPVQAKSVDPTELKGADYNNKTALEFSQSAIGRVVGDYAFKDSKGQAVKLSDFRGKPLIVSLIYTNCLYTCAMITNRLDDVHRVADDALGESRYSIVTIGFDVANDTPGKMAEYARINGVDGAGNWRFLSADAATIKGLTKDLGFVYFPSDDGFTHLAQTTVIDADGKVFRQIYGETFKLPVLIDGVKDLVFNTTKPFSSFENLANKIRLFSIVYDPKNDVYRYDYSIFAHMAGGGLAILGMIWFIVSNTIKIRRRRKDAKNSAAHHPVS